MSASRKNLRLTRVDAETLLTAASSPETDQESSSTDLIVRAIRLAIMEHRLQPGAKLVEQTIGDRFGVSRTIVRQALIRLSQLKLVRLEPARGAFVAQPSIQEARQVFAVRRMVESQMLREMVDKARPIDLKRLKAHLKVERESVGRADLPTHTKLAFDFHVRLAEVLGNQVLIELIQELVSRCSLIDLMYPPADHEGSDHARHASIVRAIEARDADKAIRLMNEHLSPAAHPLTEPLRP